MDTILVTVIAAVLAAAAAWNVRAARAHSRPISVQLYCDIGKTTLAHHDQAGWGAKAIDRLSHDLAKAFPDQRGFSPRNLKYMRAFAAAWPDAATVCAFDRHLDLPRVISAATRPRPH
ncbi:DUF1016 N-terminal domain-containing protein [Povalibacter sp.]|uniref:DUF1016 N-terminal domain-containing protein n=1 Tax=Povalibacter sp. TaxID=1962978 RepID=UPI0039C9CB20